ncbi:AAA family ATPase [Oleiharenicola lentus]|uniref:AAA family ATPase n=1 Tax=Oleiharenicola lentus TaxID=2508720 RepID=UPI003F67FF47
MTNATPDPVSTSIVHPWAKKVSAEIGRAVIGQEEVVERLLVALLSNGHVLLEGMPGLAKTLLVKSLGTVLGLKCERIQFTPDLLPSDVVGTMIFQPRTGEFTPHLGPIFANLVLADEINRAPSKVQSALLEAMAERQATIGGISNKLPVPFFVMATQNPVEQEGTYPLPEAQRDRFLFKVVLDYPVESAEREMVRRWGKVTSQPKLEVRSSVEELLALREEVDRVHVSEVIESYLLKLVRATRERVVATVPAKGAVLKRGASNKPLLAYGASPRASLSLYQAGKALAWLRGHDYVSADIIQEIFPDVMRHRIGLSYEAEADGVTENEILRGVLDRTPVPATAEATRN